MHQNHLGSFSKYFFPPKFWCGIGEYGCMFGQDLVSEETKLSVSKQNKWKQNLKKEGKGTQTDLSKKEEFKH